MSGGAAVGTVGTGRGRGERRKCIGGQAVRHGEVCCRTACMLPAGALCVGCWGGTVYVSSRILRSVYPVQECASESGRCVAVDTFSSASGSERCGGDTIRFGNGAGKGLRRPVGIGCFPPECVRWLPESENTCRATGRYLSYRFCPVLSCPVLFCPVLSAAVGGKECKKPAPNIGAGFLGTGVRPPCGRR